MLSYGHRYIIVKVKHQRGTYILTLVHKLRADAMPRFNQILRFRVIIKIRHKFYFTLKSDYIIKTARAMLVKKTFLCYNVNVIIGKLFLARVERVNNVL